MKTTFINTSMFQSIMKNLNNFFFLVLIEYAISFFANLLDIWIIDPNDNDSSTLNRN